MSDRDADYLRFVRLIDFDTAPGHYLWLGTVDKHSSPIFTLDGVQQPARRVLWSWLHGPPSKPLYRYCKFRECVNPACLSEGPRRSRAA